MSRQVRKADALHGDDLTYTRFVRVTGFAGRKARGRHGGHTMPSADHPAMRDASTLFPTQVYTADEVTRLLVSGHNSVKLGRDVRAGRKFRGYWIYSLTLQERATCPRSCSHWRDCYGNNTHMAKRIDHVDLRALAVRLDAEITGHLSNRRRKGILVRLHALGDFFSVDYVEVWRALLARHERLAVFGYTARRKGRPIGDAIEALRRDYPDRFRIRWSDGGEARDCTVSIERKSDKPAGAFICPDQLDLRHGCGKCGACWEGTRNVAFLAH